MIGAYRATKSFAYPGWRLTVPGGPAGGHYKGFTHTQAAGTDLLPGDQYEQDREDGMSSHDAVHASPRNPRGVYRSSAEVPPRPNASGAAMTYRGFQTKRHAGTSISPGSFPADYFETAEDQFIPESSNVHGMGDLGDLSELVELGLVPIMVYGADGGPGVVHRIGPELPFPRPPVTGATSVVSQPPMTLYPIQPGLSVPVQTFQPVSPTPAPIVATNEVIPLNDGSGNYVNVSTGAIVSGAQVMQNPATMQLITPSALNLVPAGDGSGNYVNPQTGVIIPAAAVNASSASALPSAFSASGIAAWLKESTIIPSLPNWGLLGIGVGALLLMGGGGRHR